MQYILTEHELNRGCELIEAWQTEDMTLDFSYDDETIWQLYKHAADIFVYRVLSEIGYTDWK